MKGRIINSSIYLIFAYFLVHIAYIFSQFIILHILDLKNIIMLFFYNAYSAPELNWWTNIKVFMIFGIGFITVFLMFIIAVILFLKLSRKKYKLKLFYNWLIIVTSSFFLAEIIAAPFYHDHAAFYNVLSYLHFESGGGGMYVLALLCLPFIPLIAYFTNTNFIKTTNTTSDIRRQYLRWTIYSKVSIIPYVLLVFTLLFMSKNVYYYNMEHFMSKEGMRLIVIGSILIVGSFFSLSKKYISIKKENNTNKVDYLLNFFLLLLVASVYFMLWFNSVD